MPPALVADDVDLWYGDFQALHRVSLTVAPRRVSSLIGPSGCGKSTLLRTVNRINERLPYVRVEGSLRVAGFDVFAPEVELVQLRHKIGMVFQRPNPLPLSIRDNVLFAHRLHHAGRRLTRGEEDGIVERALRQVLLWDQVKDRLRQRATGLSLEEQQKLCIARLLPTRPLLLLMDEPCSALDPKGTEAVEELIRDLAGDYTILIVTHNMAQAKRVSADCIFMLMGKVEEAGTTAQIFENPRKRSTADYIAGRYG